MVPLNNSSGAFGKNWLMLCDRGLHAIPSGNTGHLPFSPEPVRAATSALKTSIPDLHAQAIYSHTENTQAPVSDVLLRYARNEKLFEDTIQYNSVPQAIFLKNISARE